MFNDKDISSLIPEKHNNNNDNNDYNYSSFL